MSFHAADSARRTPQSRHMGGGCLTVTLFPPRAVGRPSPGRGVSGPDSVPPFRVRRLSGSLPPGPRSPSHGFPPPFPSPLVDSAGLFPHDLARPRDRPFGRSVPYSGCEAGQEQDSSADCERCGGSDHCSTPFGSSLLNTATMAVDAPSAASDVAVHKRLDSSAAFANLVFPVSSASRAAAYAPDAATSAPLFASPTWPRAAAVCLVSVVRFLAASPPSPFPPPYAAAVASAVSILDAASPCAVARCERAVLGAADRRGCVLRVSPSASARRRRGVVRRRHRRIPRCRQRGLRRLHQPVRSRLRDFQHLS